MKHVVMFSGGICSWAAAKRVAERHGTADLILVFADTKMEDEDTYRFLREGAANVGGTLVWLRDGRDIWGVFRDERFLGNSRVAPCSKILKQRQLDKWKDENCDPKDTIVYLGIHWSEMERFHRARRALARWNVEAPMCEPPFVGVQDMHRLAAREGLRQQRLYEAGFPHANCGGGCVRGGQAQFARLYRWNRARFMAWEHGEESARKRLGDVSILTDRAGDGIKKPLTLRQLRERIEAEQPIDEFDFGGCGCLTSALEAA